MVRKRTDSSPLSACPSVLHQGRLAHDKRNADGKTLVAAFFAQVYMHNKKHIHMLINPIINCFEEKHI